MSLREQGHEINGVTLATTLSKMVGEELQKDGQAYCLKGEAPVSGENTAEASVATGLDRPN